jgi:hypothetical protein
MEVHAARYYSFHFCLKLFLCSKVGTYEKNMELPNTSFNLLSSLSIIFQVHSSFALSSKWSGYRGLDSADNKTDSQEDACYCLFSYLTWYCLEWSLQVPKSRGIVMKHMGKYCSIYISRNLNKHLWLLQDLQSPVMYSSLKNPFKWYSVKSIIIIIIIDSWVEGNH